MTSQKGSERGTAARRNFPWRVRIARHITIGMVHAMQGHPVSHRSLCSHATKNCQPFPKRGGCTECPMGKEAMQADRNAEPPYKRPENCPQQHSKLPVLSHDWHAQAKQCKATWKGDIQYEMCPLGRSKALRRHDMSPMTQALTHDPKSHRRHCCEGRHAKKHDLRRQHEQVELRSPHRETRVANP